MDKKLYLVIILIRTFQSGAKILVKLALDDGMSTFVLIFYDQALATIFLASIAVISERNRAPPLSFKVLLELFVLSLFGITFTLELYAIALDYTSPTLVAATTNTIPAITFVLAVLLRTETVDMRSLVGIAKVLGVALCMAGVMAMAFYQGRPLKSLNPHHLQLGHKTTSPTAGGNRSSGSSSSSNKTWIKGCFLMLLGNTTWSLWLVLQEWVLRQYPSKLLFTAFVCFFSTIQSFFCALIFERDFSRWKLGFDVRLLAVAYCGIAVTGFSFYLQSWCIERAGPVVLAMSTPLSFVITIAGLSFILGQTISTGSILGGFLMIGGLYSVLWGKNKEQASLISRLPVLSVEDGKGKLQMEQMSSSLPDDEAVKCRPNLQQD